ncbi:MAG: molybdopterin-dependent oxidoreductase [Chloroflexi bacterium]|nr:molybdopterin-dependent oxidoreductase [Chloroflexota bacterium]
MNNTQTHYRACNLCEAMCGLEIQVEGGMALSIRGDKADPFSQGHICPKATALADVYTDPDRLKRPLRRTASGWEEIGWEEAFDETVKGIRRVQEKYGRNTMGVYLGNPNVHNLGLMLYNAPFIRSLRTRNRFSATSIDQLPHHVAALLMFGHQLLLPIPDVDRAQFMLMLGANPLASNGSLMTAPGIERRLKQLKARGGKLVVVDPRRTETAVLADQHIFIKPGLDALLLLALIHTLYGEDLLKPGRLADFTDGFDEIAVIASDFAPERVAARLGILAETIRQLARELAGAERGVVYGRIGLSTQPFGGICQWLINVLNILTGNLDRAGGAMFTLPAFDIVGLTAMMGSTGRFGHRQTRVRGLPAFGGEFPVSALAEEILTPGDGQIRGMVTVAGNPVLSAPNGRQLDKALAELEFMVSLDIYLNETTRHAHIILPTTTGLETEHYDLVFHALAVRNTAKYAPALFPPAEGARHDWEILRELRNRLENRYEADRSTMLGKMDFQRRLRPDQILDLALRFGPYGANGINRGRLGGEGMKLRLLKNAPHGLDLGPLQPILRERLCTPSRRIVLVPEALAADVARVKAALLAEDGVENGRYPLSLIGRRQLRSNNSWMHNSPRLVKGKNRCTLLMHPADAAARGLTPGQTVNACSRVGEIELSLEVTEEIMPGVVSIPHGWGHNRPGIQMETAQAHPGASLNDLTDDQRVDDLTGNAAFSGVPVEVAGI